MFEIHDLADIFVNQGTCKARATYDFCWHAVCHNCTCAICSLHQQDWRADSSVQEHDNILNDFCCLYRPNGLNVSQAHCRLAKAWQAKGEVAVGLAVVQSQLQQDPAHQALNTLQVRLPYLGCIPYTPFCFLQCVPYSLGCGASCNSSDNLA